MTTLILSLALLTAAEIEGKVVAITDGDTLTGLVIGVLAGLTFRRSLMDALPEPVLVRHNQTICFSKEACR